MIRKILASSVVGLGLVSGAYAAPAVQLAFDLLDAEGAVIAPKPDGSYDIQVGAQFTVQLSAGVDAPYKTHASRGSSATVRNKELGINFLNLDILTPGSSGVAVPVAEEGSVKWAGYTDMTSFGNNVPFVNLADRDSDGDTDVAGAGYFNSTTTFSTAGQLGLVQYGAFGLEPLFTGLFSAVKPGLVNIATVSKNAKVYGDFASDNALDIEELIGAAEAARVTEASLVINVIGGTTVPSFVAVVDSAPVVGAQTINFTGNLLYQPPVDIAGGPKDVFDVNFVSAGPISGDLYVMYWLNGTPEDIAALKAEFAAEATGGTLLADGPMFAELMRVYPTAGMILQYPGMAGILDGGSLSVDFSHTGVAVSAIAAVPEPASLLSLGALGVLGMLRRRR